MYLNPLTGLAEDNGFPVVPDPGANFPWGVNVLPD